jgi:chromatin segregation and condensation protein Rec8/ScpA/Scc1 (kleisin family)
MLHLDGFDGPIDLLLDLAERQRLDLGRISLARTSHTRQQRRQETS